MSLPDNAPQDSAQGLALSSPDIAAHRQNPVEFQAQSHACTQRRALVTSSLSLFDPPDKISSLHSSSTAQNSSFTDRAARDHPSSRRPGVHRWPAHSTQATTAPTVAISEEGLSSTAERPAALPIRAPSSASEDLGRFLFKTLSVDKLGSSTGDASMLYRWVTTTWFPFVQAQNEKILQIICDQALDMPSEEQLAGISRENWEQMTKDLDSFDNVLRKSDPKSGARESMCPDEDVGDEDAAAIEVEAWRSSDSTAIPSTSSQASSSFTETSSWNSSKDVQEEVEAGEQKDPSTKTWEDSVLSNNPIDEDVLDVSSDFDRDLNAAYATSEADFPLQLPLERSLAFSFPPDGPDSDNASHDSTTRRDPDQPNMKKKRTRAGAAGSSSFQRKATLQVSNRRRRSSKGREATPDSSSVPTSQIRQASRNKVAEQRAMLQQYNALLKSFAYKLQQYHVGSPSGARTSGIKEDLIENYRACTSKTVLLTKRLRLYRETTARAPRWHERTGLWMDLPYQYFKTVGAKLESNIGWDNPSLWADFLMELTEFLRLSEKKSPKDEVIKEWRQKNQDRLLWMGAHFE
ncbi:hypothetical protein IAU59_007543 [Kwoniella sp. CBS 9459]